MNHRTLIAEKLLSSSPSRKSAFKSGNCSDPCPSFPENRRFSQIRPFSADFHGFTPSPGNSSIWRAQKTEKIFTGNHRKPQIGLGHLRSVTFSSALKKVTYPLLRPMFFAAQWGDRHFSAIFLFLHTGRKLLPTDFLLFQINSVQTYRYRYRSVSILN